MKCVRDTVGLEPTKASLQAAFDQLAGANYPNSAIIQALPIP